MKTFDSEFLYIEVWFADQSSNPSRDRRQHKKTRYLVQPKDPIFVKGYRFFSFAKNMSKNICKNISKTLSSKYSLLAACQKILDLAEQSGTDALKTPSKEQFEKQQKQLVI